MTATSKCGVSQEAHVSSVAQNNFVYGFFSELVYFVSVLLEMLTMVRVNNN